MATLDDHPDAQRWNRRYSPEDVAGSPSEVLSRNLHLLPPRGQALDLACGLGADAMLMARHGLDVEAWDISANAIFALERQAESLSIQGVVRDAVAHPPAPEQFDVILVARFLERSLSSHLMDALKPGGLLFYQTFSNLRIDDSGPTNPDFRLADNELLTLFAPLRIRVYREEGGLGNTDQGFRNQAMLIAQKA
ncbi:MAG: methyltransferase domain-containing protein [Gammaproteobacteria bacterium]|nr:methyltransferase domain-containing protein [Gammaproteobacteria bacterium]